MKRCPIPRVCTPEPLNWGRPVYQHPGGTFRWREPFSDEEAPMDANSGEPWSEMDITDLKHSVEYGEHDRTDCELPVPRRGRGPREDNGTWVAPDKRRVVISRITTTATPLEVATHDPSRTKKERYPGAAQKKSPAGKRGESMKGFRSPSLVPLNHRNMTASTLVSPRRPGNNTAHDGITKILCTNTAVSTGRWNDVALVGLRSP
jgi:hypothetical protein